jgi:hypothetical protein
MTSDVAFWQHLESTPALAAPLIEWQDQLGEWPVWVSFQKQHLQLTRGKATAIECLDGCYPIGCSRNIVEHGQGNIVAVCPHGEERPYPVTPKGVLIYRLNSATLHAEISKELNLEIRHDSVSDFYQTWQLGSFVVPSGKRFPVFITCQNDNHEFADISKQLCLTTATPFALLAPTRQYLSREAEQLLVAHGSIFLSLADEFRFEPNGKLLRKCDPSLMFRQFFPAAYWARKDDNLPANIFRQRGSRWEMRFKGGEIFYINSQRGAEYITTLLAAPNKGFSVLDLYHGGVAPEEVKASLDSNEYEGMDLQYLKECKDRLDELSPEIEAAQDSHNLTELESLHRENDELLKMVKEETKAGRMPKKTRDPLKKPRDAVNRSIRKVIKGIAIAKHGILAEHFDKSITSGGEKTYKPHDEIWWETTPIAE